LVPNHIEVSLAWWQDTSEGWFRCWIATQGAGEGFRGALGVGFDGKAHFGEGGSSSLAATEIAYRQDPSAERGKPFWRAKRRHAQQPDWLPIRKRRQIQPDSEDAGFNDRAET